jgi:hypothetical protein
MSIPKKRKLTLTVDNDVIDKAKEIGLNLSDITEKVLRGFAFSPKQGDKAEVYAKYRELFAIMKPLLVDYGTSVEIANYMESPEDVGDINTILLTPDGDFWNSEAESGFSEIEKIPLWALHQPTKILANFIKSLSEEKQKRKETIGELEMARRIVLAMSKTLQSKPRSRRTGKS